MHSLADLTVGAAGEGEVLARILAIVGGASAAIIGPGDDAAVLAAPDHRVVITTDTLVHGPDFRLAWTSGIDLGYKSAAVNLSDVAAMGATPTALFVALMLPENTLVSFVEDLARGMVLACAELAPGTAIEGGDLTASDTLAVAVTAVGMLEGRHPVLRSGARPGDAVAVAGNLGLAARGLAVLFGKGRDASGTPVPLDLAALTAEERADLSAQLRPQPPIALGRAASRAGATAMMDLSDGLVLDATRMATASGVTIDITDVTDPLALAGGEDHSLLATFRPGAALPEGFRSIGTVLVAGTCPVTVAGAAPAGRGGWDPYLDWDARLG